MTVLTVVPPVTEPKPAGAIVTDWQPAATGLFTNMPRELLTKRELAAYSKGYCRGTATYTRKNGGGGVSGADLGVTYADLHARQDAALVARQPSAHRAGMSELRRHVKKYGSPERLEEIESAVKSHAASPTPEPKPAAKPKRKPATRKPKPAPVVADPVPVPTVAETVAAAPMTLAAKRQSRRELAARMRAAGIEPRGEAWEAAKREAGIR